MSKVTEFLWHELRKSIAPTLFFFTVFETTVWIRSLMGAPAGVTITSTPAALAGALLVSKAILVADGLRPFRWFRRRLAVNVAWRALLYMVLIVAFQVLEELIKLSLDHGFGTAISEMEHAFEHELNWPLFWGTHALLMVFLLVYSFGTATVELIGRRRFYAVFFGVGASGGSDPNTSG